MLNTTPFSPDSNVITFRRCSHPLYGEILHRQQKRAWIVSGDHLNIMR
jgi:hypothetical protein